MLFSRGVGVSRPILRAIWWSRNCCSLNCLGLLNTPIAVAFPRSFGFMDDATSSSRSDEAPGLGETGGIGDLGNGEIWSGLDGSIFTFLPGSPVKVGFRSRAVGPAFATRAPAGPLLRGLSAPANALRDWNKSGVDRPFMPGRLLIE